MTMTDAVLLRAAQVHRVANQDASRYDEFLDLADTYWRLPDALSVVVLWALQETGWRRLAAVDLLGRAESSAPEHDRAAATALLQVLAHADDDDLATAAIDALGMLGHDSALPALLRAASSDVVGVRESVAAALAGVLSDPIDDDTKATLLSLLEDEASEVRDWAAFCFRQSTEWDAPQVRERLRARCVDTDPEVRHEAVKALAQRGDEAAVAFVQSMLLEGDAADLVVAAAAETGDERLFRALQRLWDWGPTSALLATALSWTDPSRRAAMLWWETDLVLAVHAQAAARDVELLDLRLHAGFPRTRMLVIVPGAEGEPRAHDLGRVRDPTEPDVLLPSALADMMVNELLRR